MRLRSMSAFHRICGGCSTRPTADDQVVHRKVSDGSRTVIKSRPGSGHKPACPEASSGGQGNASRLASLQVKHDAQLPPYAPLRTGVAFLCVFVAAFFWLSRNNPSAKRLDAARRGLAEAGFSGAHVERQQLPSNMARCGIGQIRKRGSAYGWNTATAKGLFCLREDGRPSRVIVDQAPSSSPYRRTS